MSAKGTATFFFILIFMCSSLILRNIVINYSKILPNCTKTILQKKSCLTAAAILEIYSPVHFAAGVARQTVVICKLTVQQLL